ncbi:MAG: nuclear transport factor 2 family protein, partial [Burkholderiaceae bacterium]|nr:nuclear transport factor 2 family protein [Burkholderiaceae bacterium]
AAPSVGQSVARTSPATGAKHDAAPPGAPTPPSGAAGAAMAEKEIADFVDGWLAAWSRKEVKGYLAHYDAQFSPPQGMTRAAWEAERAQRLSKPGPIAVSREKLRVVFDGNEHATVTMRQHYRSATFSASTQKTLHLVRRNGQWRIVKEVAG